MTPRKKETIFNSIKRQIQRKEGRTHS